MDMDSAKPDSDSSRKNNASGHVLLYYLGGIGEPNVPLKLRLLRENLEHLAEQKDVAEIDLIVNVYSSFHSIQKEIRAWKWRSVTSGGKRGGGGGRANEGTPPAQDCLQKEPNKSKFRDVFFHCEDGILAQLWATNRFHTEAQLHSAGYSAVLFTLDDVQLLSFPISRTLEVMKQHGLDILSPRISNASHAKLMASFPDVPGMVGDAKWSRTLFSKLRRNLSSSLGTEEAGGGGEGGGGEGGGGEGGGGEGEREATGIRESRAVVKGDLKLVNMCEWYAYLLSPTTFQKLLALHSAKNPSCWGVDVVLGRVGFNVGIWAGAHCHHLFKGRGDNRQKFADMDRFLAKFGFSGLRDTLARCQPVKKTIDSGVHFL
jgi:hypothetical protein